MTGSSFLNYLNSKWSEQCAFINFCLRKSKIILKREDKKRENEYGETVLWTQKLKNQVKTKKKVISSSLQFRTEEILSTEHYFTENTHIALENINLTKFMKQT